MTPLTRLFVFIFLDAFSIFFVIPNWIVLVKSVSGGYDGYTIVQTVFYITAVLFEIPTGIFADKKSRIYSMNWGMGLRAATLFGYVFAQNLTHVIILEIISGIGSSFVSGTYDALMIEVAEHEHYDKTRLFSRAALIFSIAATLGGIFGSYISITDLRTPYLIAGCLGIISIIVINTVTERRIAPNQNILWFWKESVRTVKTSHPLKLIFLLQIPIAALALFRNYDIGVIKVEYGDETIVFWWILTSVVYTPLTHIAKKLSNTTTFTAWIMVAIALCLTIGSYLPLMAFLGFRLCSIALNGIGDVLLNTIPNQYLNEDIRATSLSMISLARRLIEACYLIPAYFLFKICGETTEQVFLLWQIGSGVMLAIGLFCLYQTSKNQKPVPEHTLNLSIDTSI